MLLAVVENNILYTTHCPSCNVLKQNLDKKNINYTEFTDVDKMLEMGMKSAPMLSVDGKLMNFVEAMNWVKNY